MYIYIKITVNAIAHIISFSVLKLLDKCGALSEYLLYIYKSFFCFTHLPRVHSPIPAVAISYQTKPIKHEKSRDAAVNRIEAITRLSILDFTIFSGIGYLK